MTWCEGYKTAAAIAAITINVAAPMPASSAGAAFATPVGLTLAMGLIAAVDVAAPEEAYAPVPVGLKKPVDATEPVELRIVEVATILMTLTV